MAFMDRYVALLRGINVGGHRRVAMADLRTLLGGLGYGDVATYVQSGNAVFTAGGKDPATVAEEIRVAIDTRFGLDVPTVVRTGAQLRAAVDDNPLAVADPSGFLVLFCSEAPDAACLAGIDPSLYPRERMAVVGSHVYTIHEQGIGHAKLPGLVARRVGGTTTGRNWRTVLRLLELAGG
ncbi:DUF1697 domain-containing protein [Nocardiopsis quinghaiensis]|uniref:DUF1697 domain-containing protein n=1 Tax=Nocardiopsis quinghaiensis TaxID=464995 RepID=UPI00123B371B|nr:DUF1697 domain-containing protein [Nocardiopsis quinghaiensis]